MLQTVASPSFDTDDIEYGSFNSFEKTSPHLEEVQEYDEVMATPYQQDMATPYEEVKVTHMQSIIQCP